MAAALQRQPTMSDLFPVSLDDMIDEVNREVSMRERVYMGLIARGKMTPDVANRRIAVMRAIGRQLRDERDRELSVLAGRNTPKGT